MAINYPLNIPTVGVTSVNWTNATASFISRSPFTFQGQSQNYGGAIRYAQVSVQNRNRDDAEEWVGFLDSLFGTKGTFLLGDPMGVKPRGSLTGNLDVRGGGQSGSSLSVQGGPASTNRILRTGDWIQLGTGVNSRIYKSLTNVNTNSSGYATIEIWPALRSSPADSDTIYTQNTKGLFRRSSGTFNYSEYEGCKYDITFDCEEVI